MSLALPRNKDTEPQSESRDLGLKTRAQETRGWAAGSSETSYPSPREGSGTHRGKSLGMMSLLVFSTAALSLILCHESRLWRESQIPVLTLSMIFFLSFLLLSSEVSMIFITKSVLERKPGKSDYVFCFKRERKGEGL